MRTKSRIQYLIRGLMAAELICAVILLVCFACMPRAQIVLDASNTQALQGAWQEDGRYVCMQGSAGVCLQSVPLSLDAGVYRAEVSYDADAEAALLLHDESGGYHQLLTTAVSMYDRTKATEASVGIYLKHHTDGAILEILYGAGAELTVSSLTLTATGQQYTIWLLWLLLISLLADGTLLLYDRWQRGVLSKAQLSCGMLLVAIWIVSCLPLMTDQAVYQDDLFFHLTRIRGILDAWKDGQFPARLQPGWVNGMGYPLSIMYGDLLLWPTVVLYAATGQIVLAYRIGVALLNLLTVGIGYLSFYGMFQSRKAAVCCSGLYVCAIYRLNNLYIRAAVGEATAMTFLPLIAWALSGLFHRDETEASDPKYLWILVLGMSGVLQSHVLSTEFAVALCILLFVIYWKRALRRKVLFHILEAIGLVALLNLWWLVPMLEYMSSLDLLVFHNWYSLQESGLYPAQLLSLFAFAGDSAFTGTNGMQNVRPFTIGIALMGALVLYGYQRLSGTNQMQCGKPEMQQHVRSIAQAAAIVAVVTLVLSLQIFPWDAIYEAGGIPAKIVASIQKPYRLLTIATVAAVVVAGALIREAGEHPKRATLLAGLFLSLGILQAAFVTEDLLFHKPQIAIENVEAIGTETLAGAEYIRNGVEYRSLSATQILFGEGVHGEVLAQDGTMRRLQLQNESTQLSYAEVSLLWYPGYQAMDTERGELLTVDASDTGRVRVWLPAGFEGEVIVAFHARPLWRAADLISLCTLLILLFVGIRAARNAAKDALQI